MIALFAIGGFALLCVLLRNLGLTWSEALVFAIIVTTLATLVEVRCGIRPEVSNGGIRSSSESCRPLRAQVAQAP